MLSIFKGYADTMPVAVSLDEVVRLIREDKVLADHTEKYRYYRSQGQKTAAGREKSACPALPWRCVLRTGNGRPISVAGRVSRWWTLTICLKDGRGKCSKRCVPTRTPCWLIPPSAGRGEGGVPLLPGWRDA